jgi:glycosyltransferase involved in cell wall biosynthesis
VSRTPELSVVIPTYNGGWVLGRTLEAIRAQDAPPDCYEVIVVDDGSSDGSVNGLAGYGGPATFRVIRQSHHGRAAARNHGATEARGRVLLFLDSDIWATPSLISAHLAHHDGRRGLGVQGRSLQHPDSLTTLFMRASHMMYDWTVRRREGLSPYHVITRNFSVDADAFRGAGGFDEQFVGYGWEDIELAFRLVEQGVTLRWEPDALAFHYQVETLEEACAKQVQSGRGAVYFWKKYGRSRQLGLFLEIHPVLLPLKWLVYRSGVLTAALHPARRIGERLGLTLVCSEVYNHLKWQAFYQGVFDALREAP